MKKNISEKDFQELVEQTYKLTNQLAPHYPAEWFEVNNLVCQFAAEKTAAGQEVDVAELEVFLERNLR